MTFYNNIILRRTGHNMHQWQLSSYHRSQHGLQTTAIVTMAEVVEHLYNKEYKGRVVIDDKLKAAIDAYYDQYGAE